jgi:hypothetical protein
VLTLPASEGWAGTHTRKAKGAERPHANGAFPVLGTGNWFIAGLLGPKLVFPSSFRAR